VAALKALKNDALKALASSMRLTVGGNKDALVARILAAPTPAPASAAAAAR
jgi:hypothetical protein